MFDNTSLSGRPLLAPVLAIGNCDGMHRGHRAVLRDALDLAKTLDRPAALLTFEPHPRTVFNPAQPVFRLTPPEIKATIAQSLGLDALIVQTFDAGFASLTAADFLQSILVEGLNASGLVIGHDFHFGKGREGSPAFLQTHAHIPVHVVAPIEQASVPVSSSSIRTHLEKGEVSKANDLLGYRWFVRGPVLHGHKRGRDLNYPTANLRLGDDCRLRHGIYAVRVAVAGNVMNAVASFGRRPTFDNGAPLLEVHLFDWSGDLYGQTIDVEFVSWIRGEERFESVEALITRMDEDSKLARRVLREDVRQPSLIGVN